MTGVLLTEQDKVTVFQASDKLTADRFPEHVRALHTSRHACVFWTVCSFSRGDPRGACPYTELSPL